MTRILVVNDKLSLNQLYRTRLIARLQTAGLSVTEIGLFKGGRPTLHNILKVLLGHEERILSSNLRSNTVALLAFWRRGMVILNGMGRYRGRRAARRLIGWLLLLNRRKAIVIQSRADFRYFRRYAAGANLHWIPGSGGSEKPVAEGLRPLAVQRPDKIGVVAESLNSYFTATGTPPEMVLVGCPNSAEIQAAFPGITLELTGHVPPEDLFLRGGLFLQPTGYGEGVPHTLVDAIVSRMPVAIARIEYLRYGFAGLGITAVPIGPGWCRLIVPEAARLTLTTDKVSQDYAEILLET